MRRSAERAQRRADKLGKLQELVDERNAVVQESPRAKAEAGVRQLGAWAKRYKLTAFVTLSLEDRRLRVPVDDNKKAQAALLDGCYVIEMDVARETMDAGTVDHRYRDLQQVERNFRQMKTFLLEVRPICVRKKRRTSGHVFAAMLALKLARELDPGLKKAFGASGDSERALTIEDALRTLSRLCFQCYPIAGQKVVRLPRPDPQQEAIFKALNIPPPRHSFPRPIPL